MHYQMRQQDNKQAKLTLAKIDGVIIEVPPIKIRVHPDHGHVNHFMLHKGLKRNHQKPLVAQSMARNGWQRSEQAAATTYSPYPSWSGQTIRRFSRNGMERSPRSSHTPHNLRANVFINQLSFLTRNPLKALGSSQGATTNVPNENQSTHWLYRIRWPFESFMSISGAQSATEATNDKTQTQTGMDPAIQNRLTSTRPVGSH